MVVEQSSGVEVFAALGLSDSYRIKVRADSSPLNPSLRQGAGSFEIGDTISDAIANVNHNTQAALMVKP